MFTSIERCRTAVRVLNKDVLLSFEQGNARIESILSDSGREFCGRPDRRRLGLFLRSMTVRSVTARSSAGRR